MARRPRTAGAVIAGLLVVSAACSSDEGGDGGSATTSAATSPDAPALDLADVAVAVEFPRYLQVDRAGIEVVVDNRGASAIEVTDVVLRSPLFEVAEGGGTRSTTVRPGRRVDIKVGLGASVCPAASGASHVELTADVDGVRRRGLVAVEPEPLEKISATDCGRERVRQHVDIGFSPDFTVSDGVVDADVSLSRLQGDDDVTMDAVRGSVILELRGVDEASPLAAMAPGEQSLDVPVQLRVVRCDPHAVTESKKTFQLSTWIGLGDAEPQHVIISPDGELRATLEDLIQQCLRAESAG